MDAPFKMAVGLDLLPPYAPYRVRFQMARDAGFEAVEMSDVSNDEEVEEAREASVQTGLKIHSVATMLHWKYPISSADPDVIAQCLRVTRTTLSQAKRWGADTLLLNAGVVDAQTSYRDAYARSQAAIRNEIAPMAKEFGIVIGIENMMISGFLVSPLEYVRYIDELESPWVRAYLDVGNMIFGHPEHWIRTAGSRTVKLHLKDFRLDWASGTFRWGKIGEGAIDWRAVRKALLDVGYAGYITNAAMSSNSRLSRLMARGMGLCRRRPVRALPGSSAVTRALSAVRLREDFVFLQDVARRFERFREGNPD